MHNTTFTCRALLSTTLIKMETFFMNSKNSKTSELNRFKYDLIDKLDFKNPNKNMALANLIFITLGKMLNQLIIIIYLKYQYQLGMKHLICLMDRVIYQKFKIILNI